ncbi:DoxX family protein [Streptomyces capillispiralis]|uniref:DoxX-like protein n=1 Tax=Streptomyces capillispiralis TaxID=68182 RepID=A0A561TC89_9ACTN|nr:DoxX family protein [Streptomyces capillispiralis]TWF84735.1 DoxX-like protein [Streptomyces capillispiralis]GHH95797.1 membrane protein [Streptomyces capillispiralis]
MFIAYVVVACLLALALVASARAKLTRDEKITAGMRQIGVQESWFAGLAALEIAGALGLVAGIFYRPLGIAAGIGVVLYFVGAIITHLRAKDTKGLPAPTVMLLLGVTPLLLGIATV